jgi:hypothetical protein
VNQDLTREHGACLLGPRISHSHGCKFVSYAGKSVASSKVLCLDHRSFFGARTKTHCTDETRREYRGHTMYAFVSTCAIL